MAQVSQTQSFYIDCTEEQDNSDKVLQIPQFLIAQCGTLRDILESCPLFDEPIPMPCDRTLAMLLLEYCKLHEEHEALATRESSNDKHDNRGGAKEISFARWETEFADDHLCGKTKSDQYQKDVMLFQLLNFANFLDYCELLHFVAKVIAVIIRNNNEEDLRERFGVRDQT